MTKKKYLKKGTIALAVTMVMSMSLVGCSDKKSEEDATTERSIITVEEIVDEPITESNTIEEVTTEANVEDATTEVANETPDEFRELELSIDAKMISVGEVESKDFVSLSYICLDENGTLYDISSLNGEKIAVLAENTGLTDILYGYKDESTLFVIDSSNNYIIVEMSSSENVLVSMETGKLKDNFIFTDIYISDTNKVSVTVLDTGTGQIYDSLYNYKTKREDLVYINDDDIWCYSPTGTGKYLIDGNIKDELNGWVLTNDGTLYIHDAGSTIAEDEPCEYLQDTKFTDLIGVSKVNRSLSFAITESNELYMLNSGDSDSSEENMVRAIISGLDGEIIDATYNENAKKVVIKTSTGFYKIDYDLFQNKGTTITAEAVLDETYNSLEIIDMYNSIVILSDGRVLTSKK